MTIPQFVLFLIGGHLGYFQFDLIMNNAIIHIHVQVLVWTYVFISLGYIPAVGLLVVVYVYQKLPNSFPKWFYRVILP